MVWLGSEEEVEIAGAVETPRDLEGVAADAIEDRVASDGQAAQPRRRLVTAKRPIAPP